MSAVKSHVQISLVGLLAASCTRLASANIQER